MWHYMGPMRVYGAVWGSLGGYLGVFEGHTDPVEVQVCGPEEGAGPGGEIWGQKGPFWVLWGSLGSLEVITSHYMGVYGAYGGLWGSLGGYLKSEAKRS